MSMLHSYSRSGCLACFLVACSALLCLLLLLQASRHAHRAAAVNRCALLVRSSEFPGLSTAAAAVPTGVVLVSACSLPELVFLLCYCCACWPQLPSCTCLLPTQLPAASAAGCGLCCLHSFPCYVAELLFSLTCSLNMSSSAGMVKGLLAAVPDREAPSRCLQISAVAGQRSNCDYI
jgi:hypothetical protein